MTMETCDFFRYRDEQQVRQVRFLPEAEAVGLKGSTIMCLDLAWHHIKRPCW